MKKVGIIAGREYFSRVKKPQFILLTLGAPILFGLFILIVGLIFSYTGSEEKKILVSDPSGILEQRFEPSGNIVAEFRLGSRTELLEVKSEEGFDGILLVPEVEDPQVEEVTLRYISDQRLNIDLDQRFSSYFNNRLRDWKIKRLGLDEMLLDRLNTRVRISSSTDLVAAASDEDDSDVGSSIAPYVAGGIGLVIAMLIYFMVFINGTMIMRSVMEEKVNRIVEIMISTVRPFDLMMGKLLGVGAVGVTQILIWLIFIPLVYFGIIAFFGSSMDMSGTGMSAEDAPEVDAGTIAMVMRELAGFNWVLISVSFIFYYLGGFFLYSSLFGALGAMMGDDLGENNSLSLVVTIPIILAIYIGIVAVQSPNSTLAVWSSMFPLFSPIVMPCRLAFDPPLWQVGVSFITLIVFTLLIVWFSGKIYRVGILMYGKKATVKELIKWLRTR
ncbi:MAG: ABC transporter permease [Saprospirales bacterium]|nr:MAG: ABC transporter permease [Saprospirales bacterium]